MSTSIDERVVQMSFDNKQFEQGAQESLATLDKLKDSLDFDGVGDFLTNLGDNVDSRGLEDLGRAANETKGHFSALDNVWNTIIAGSLLRLGSALTDTTLKLLDQVNPIKTIGQGWEAYANKTEAVQTIMAATREQFSETDDQMAIVSEQLDRLNWFSDETSYSFLDMTSNVGKFTSQGIGLEESVTAMQGISTWAAISGAKVSEAGRAMYNLSQSLGTGSVKLIDWKSIENANMATVEFKQTAIDTAVAMGTLQQVGEDLYVTMQGNEVSVQNFRDGLKDGWFTNQVLTETLDKYGAYSVQLSEFTTLAAEGYDTVGDFYGNASKLMKALDEFSTADAGRQLEMLTELSNATGVSVEDLRKDFEYLNGDEFELGRRAFKAAQEAKTFQEAIDATVDASKTAWMNVFEAIFGNYEEAKVLWTNLANSLWDMFVGPIDTLASFMEAWNEGPGQGLLGGRDLLFGVEGVDPGILGNIADGFSAIFEAIGEGLSIFETEDEKGYNNWLYTVTSKIHDFSEAFAKFAEEIAPKVQNVVTVVATFIKSIGDIVSTGIKGVFNFVKGFLELIHIGDIIKGTFGAIASAFSFIVTQLKTGFERIKTVFSVVEYTRGFKEFGEAIGRIKDAIGNFLNNSIFARLKSAFDIFKSGFGEEGIGGVSKGQVNLLKFISTAFSQLADWINRAVDAVTRFAGSVTGSKAWTTLTTFFTNIGTWFTSTATGKFDIFSFFSEFKRSIAEGLGVGGVFRSAKEFPILGELTSGLSKVRNAFEDTIEAFKTGDIWSLIAKPFERVRDVISKAFESGDFSYIYNWFVGIKDRIVGFATTVGSSFGSIFKDTFILDWFNNIKAAFEWLIENVKNSGIWNAVVTVFTTIGDVISKAFNWLVSGNLSGIIENISGCVKDLVSKLKPSEKSSKNLSKIGKVLLTVLKGIGTVLAVVVGAVAMLVVKVAEFIKTSPLIQKFITFVKDAFSKIGPALTNAGEKLKSFVAALKQNEGFQKFVEVLKKTKDILLEFITTKVFTKLTEWVEKLSDKFNSFGNGENEGGILSFAGKLGDTFGNVIEWFEKVGTSISGFVSSIKDSAIWQQLTTIFQKIGDGTLEWSDIEQLIELVKEGITKKVQELIGKFDEDGEFSPGTLFEKAKNALRNFAEGLVEGWTGADLSSLTDAAKKGSLALVVALLGVFALRIVKFFNDIAGVPTSVIGTLRSLKTVLSSYADTLKAKALIDVAIAIGIFAGVLIALTWMFATFDDWDIMKAVGILGLLMFASSKLLTVVGAYLDGRAIRGANNASTVTDIMGKAVNRIATMAGISMLMLSFAEAVKILAETVELLGGLDKKEYSSGALRMLGVIGILATAVTIIQGLNLGAGKLLGIGGTAQGVASLGTAAIILALGEAVHLMVDPIKDLAELSKDGEAAEKGARTVMQIVATLAGAGGLSSMLTGLGHGGLGGGLGNAAVIIAMAFAIRLMVGPIHDLAEMYATDSDAAQKGAISIMGIIAVLAIATGLAAGIAGISGAGGFTLLGLAVAMVAVGLATKLMAEPLKKICDIGENAYIGATIIAGSIAAIALAAGYAPAGSLLSLAVDLVALAAALVIMVDPIKELSTLGEAGILTAAAIGGVLWAIGWGASFANPLQLLSLAGAMLALSVAMSLVMGAINDVEEFNSEGLKQYAATLAVTIGELALATWGIGSAATASAPGLLALGAAALGLGAGFALVMGSFDGLETNIVNVCNNLKSNLEGVFDDFHPLEALGNAWNNLGNQVDEHFVNPLQDKLKEAGEKLGDVGTNLVGYFGNEEGAALAAQKDGETYLNTYYDTINAGSEDLEASLAGMHDMTLEYKEGTAQEYAEAFSKDLAEHINNDQSAGLMELAGYDLGQNTFNGLDLSTEEGKAAYYENLKSMGVDVENLMYDTNSAGAEGYAEANALYMDALTNEETGLFPMIDTKITEQTEPMTQVVTDLMTSVKELGVDAMRPEYYSSAVGLMGSDEDGNGPGMTSGIKDSEEPLTNTTIEVTTNAAVAAGSEENKQHWWNTGINLGNGLEGGIWESLADLPNALSSWVTDTLLKVGIQDPAGVNSPSKETMWIGSMIGLGLEVGITDSLNNTSTAAKLGTKKVLDDMEEALSNADAVLSDTINPTITPVLDLSNVQNGSQYINDLLGNTRALGTIGTRVNANLDDSRSAYNKNATNGSTNTNYFTINVTGGPNASARDIANEVMDRINNDIQRRKAAFA